MTIRTLVGPRVVQDEHELNRWQGCPLPERCWAQAVLDGDTGYPTRCSDCGAAIQPVRVFRGDADTLVAADLDELHSLLEPVAGLSRQQVEAEFTLVNCWEELTVWLEEAVVDERLTSTPEPGAAPDAGCVHKTTGPAWAWAQRVLARDPDATPSYESRLIATTEY